DPVWLAQQGGWENPEAPILFQRYVEKVVDELGGLVQFWITINEPIVYALQAYWEGSWPPQKKRNWRSMQKVIRHLARAHTLAYRVIHHVLPQAKVGIAQHFIAGLSPFQSWRFHHRFLRTTAGTHDFLGVNYYFSRRRKTWPGPRSDMDWPIDPAGLTQVLLSLRSYGLPIYITENGVADSKDRLRGDFIRDHLRAIEKAQAEGADVRGYLYWSLLDNFEWQHGFAPRFGLVEVDYETMERRVRSSAYAYKAIIEQARQPV
ncbi:MAG: family 1 glycosylhydrolase, partial [Patescibacteria group bacterium]